MSKKTTFVINIDVRQEVINVAALGTSLVEFTQWTTCIIYPVNLMPIFCWKLTPFSIHIIF